MLGYAEGPQDLALGGTVERAAHRGPRAARRRRSLARRRPAEPLRQGLRAAARPRPPGGLAPGGRPRGSGGRGPGRRRPARGVPAPVPRQRAGARPRRGDHRPAASAPYAWSGSTRFPTTTNGKPDHAALARARPAAGACGSPPTEASPTAASVRDLLAVVLARPDATVDDSFVSLAGDSLSFVEASTRLAEHLGTLPQDWHRRSARDLAAAARPPRRRGWVPTEVPSLLRALAILAVVVTHCDLVLVPGGAHVLLAVAGYNLSRFALAGSTGRARVGRVLGSLAAIVVPAAAVDRRRRRGHRPVPVEHRPHAQPGRRVRAVDRRLAVLVHRGARAGVPARGGPDGGAGRGPAPRPGPVRLRRRRGDGHARAAVPAGRRRGRRNRALRGAGGALVHRPRLVGDHRHEREPAGPGGRPSRRCPCMASSATRNARRSSPWASRCCSSCRRCRCPGSSPSRSAVGAASFWIYVTHWQVYPPLEDSGHPVGRPGGVGAGGARRLGGLRAAAVGAAPFGGLRWRWLPTQLSRNRTANRESGVVSQQV